MPGFVVAFEPRAVPLDPVCVVGVGPIARALAERALRNDARELAALRGVASRTALFLLGEPEALPGVDGALYLGRDPDAPLLLLPTQLRPNVPVESFERALIRRAAGVEPPLAVLAEPPLLASVAGAHPTDHARLRAWLGESS